MEYIDIPGIQTCQIAVIPDPSNTAEDRNSRIKQLSLPEEFIKEGSEAFFNIAFDESSGKVCIVAGKPARFLFLDYGS